MSQSQIFISYAKEDAEIARHMKVAFDSLSEELAQKLSVILDEKSFVTGANISVEMLEKLETSDVLFVIYTGRLKKSHFTGFEIGAFYHVRHAEIKSQNKSRRRVVTMYYGDPPTSEGSVLGIPISLKNDSGPLWLGGRDEIQKFMSELVDIVVEKQEDALEKLADQEEKKRERRALYDRRNKCKQKIAAIVGNLENQLLDVLSGMAVESTIEQDLIEVTWARPDVTRKIEPAKVMQGSTLNFSDCDTLKIFGIQNPRHSVTWDQFKTKLQARRSSDCTFILNAVENAVGSALQAGPADNEQLFLSPAGERFRVIVTRYYVCHDRSTTLHVYFVPMLSPLGDEDCFTILALLTAATKFRALFLSTTAPLSVNNFIAKSFDRHAVAEMLREFLRHLALIECGAHAYQLDDPTSYIKLEAYDDPKQVADLFRNWYEQRKSVVDKISAVLAAAEAPSAPKFSQLLSEWVESYRAFTHYIEAINLYMGAFATNKLGEWFTGDRTATAPRGGQNVQPLRAHPPHRGAADSNPLLG